MAERLSDAELDGIAQDRQVVASIGGVFVEAARIATTERDLCVSLAAELLAYRQAVREWVETRAAYTQAEAHRKALNDRAEYLYREWLKNTEPESVITARRRENLADCLAYTQTHTQARRAMYAAEAALRALVQADQEPAR